MTANEFKSSIVALACWSAAPQDLHPVMLAVGCALRNRVLSGLHPDIYEAASWYLLQRADPDVVPDLRHPEFLNLLYRVDSLIAGFGTDPTDGATNWYDTKKAHATAGRITATIGSLTFWK